VVDRLVERGVLAGVPAQRLWPDRPELANLLVVAATETNSEADLDLYASTLAEVL
jgi:glycine dehydrogenase subunit 1